MADLPFSDLDATVADRDAVVFATAGLGGHYDEVDLRGADRLTAVVEDARVRRFALISASGAHDPSSWGAAYADYLTAKRDGEEAVKAHDLDWTAVRPASLGSGGGTGAVTLLTSPGGSGRIDHVDVARTVAAALERENTTGKSLELWSGETPIAEAVAGV